MNRPSVCRRFLVVAPGWSQRYGATLIGWFHTREEAEAAKRASAHYRVFELVEDALEELDPT
jgi:hypothetical protein